MDVSEVYLHKLAMALITSCREPKQTTSKESPKKPPSRKQRSSSSNAPAAHVVHTQPTAQPTGSPALIERPAELFLWDKDDGHFLKQHDIIASIVKRPSGTYDYWLSASTPDGQQLLAHKVHTDLNVRWSSKLASLTWNHVGSDGLISSWCFKFFEEEDYKAFQAAYAQFSYEALNSMSWEKTKVSVDALSAEIVRADIFAA